MGYRNPSLIRNGCLIDIPICISIGSRNPVFWNSIIQGLFEIFVYENNYFIGFSYSELMNSKI